MQCSSIMFLVPIPYQQNVATIAEPARQGFSATRADAHIEGDRFPSEALNFAPLLAAATEIHDYGTIVTDLQDDDYKGPLLMANVIVVEKGLS